ncbi:hypothetical protein PVAND_014282 [Polypedilum vanderplanki]|uniref:Uncharacterized protein n=1 Tax=Polypedilum vanderplanki TaxID=319348 RepID=A0A9J6CS97_POLVA|nr:hypothetical protein PVAND_014282 [Polypedilum vanderplanki]
MKILLIFFLFGVCFANKLTPWSSQTQTKVIFNVPYKIDTDANFSNSTMKAIKSDLKSTAHKLNVVYKAVENESIYLLITSLEKCAENRLNNVNNPNNEIIICVDSSRSKSNLYISTLMGIEMNKKISN